MSGIRGLGGVPAPVAAARAARGGGGFRLAGSEATRTDGALAAGAVAAPALSLLALQESGAAAERDLGLFRRISIGSHRHHRRRAA